MNEAIPRRKMRRPQPVAGGLPYAPRIEARHPAPPPQLPLYAWVLLGAAGLAAAAGIGCVVAQAIWTRVYGDLIGSVTPRE